MTTPTLIAAMGAALVVCGLAAIIAFRRAVPASDRSYMDPLPPALRPLWPLVLFVSHYFNRLFTVEYLVRVQLQLVRAGMSYRMRAEHFVALRVVSALLLGILTCGALALVGHVGIAVPLLGAGFGAAMPQLKLRERRRIRERHIARMLPTYLDFITMAVEAGLSLPAALLQATANGPPGLLKDELDKVTRDITAGAGRIEALEAMADRLDMRQVTGLLCAIAQAERSGGSIGGALRAQAEQQRIERFQRAEKLAMEAPVKLIFPLVVFIFPTTFIVLGFPIVMKMLHQV